MHAYRPNRQQANQQNAQLSTGPVSPEGKAISSLNNLRHGLTGAFVVLQNEDQAAFDSLASLQDEFNSSTTSEALLVDRMAQYEWLANRALLLQSTCFDQATGLVADDQKFALYLRYQTTNQRAFSKCLNDLLKLRSERRKEAIGFESQKAREAEERRRQEMHEARVRSLNSNSQYREIDSDIRQTLNAPLPGHMRVPFEDLHDAMKMVMTELSDKLQERKAA